MKSNKSALIVLCALAAGFIAAAPATADAFLFEVGVGLKGGFNGSAGPGIDKTGFIQDGEGQTYEISGIEYYSHVGFGGAFGPVLELRALGFLGLETGFYYSRDNATGWVDKNEANTGRTIARIYSEQETTAYHIPVLLRANVPNPLVRPFLGIGLEFVRQSTSSLEYRQEARQSSFAQSDIDRIQNFHQISPSNYTLLLASVGMELKFGPFRVPVEIRAGYNLGFDDSLSARASFDSDTEQIFYDGAYQGHFGIFSGFIYDFDFIF